MPTLPIRTVLLLGALLIAGSAPAVAQRVVYVDAAATGAGNGTSWADAYREVRTALAAALDGDELWVARGTYKPTAIFDNRQATFALRDGVALYGGFDGTETARGERDWSANETVLSGNIGVATDSTDNSYHVVTANGVDSTAVLDGFTIAFGWADAGSAFPNGRGGGLYAETGSPAVRNVHFLRNGGYLGGGAFNGAGTAPLFEGIIFEQNYSVGGGGAYNQGGTPRFIDCRFEQNRTSGGGGLATEGGVSNPSCVLGPPPIGPVS